MSETRLTVSEAYRILDLAGPVPPAELSAAFRRVAKAVHPDSPRGDVVLFRYVVEAYHLLQQQPRPRALLGSPPSHLRVVRPAPQAVITPMQALKGGITTVFIRDRQYRLRLAPGLRHGDRLRLKNIGTIPVTIKPAQGLAVFDNDLFFQTTVEDHFLRDGGRVEFDTPVGRQNAWLVPDMEAPVRLCFKGLGLPARGSKPQGDLFVALEGRAPHVSEAQHRRQRFTQLWTTQASAA